MTTDEAPAREARMTSYAAAGSSGAPTPDEALRRILSNITYEVMPFKGTYEKVVAAVPTSVRITVTASPAKSLGDTVDLAVRLAGAGYRVVPHLSARMLTGRDELRRLLDTMAEAGIDAAFVIGGDGEPSGEFSDALGVLEALAGMEHHVTDLGVGGYPEGHPGIPDEALWTALKQKAPYARHIVTQICFDPRATLAYAAEVRRRGIDLPISVGMPGAVHRQKLMRIVGKIGMGDSARFLHKQHSLIWKFFSPGGYNPKKLIKGLTPHLAEPDCPIEGFHIFTFNDVEGTEAWRQKLLQRTPSSPTERQGRNA